MPIHSTAAAVCPVERDQVAEQYARYRSLILVTARKIAGYDAAEDICHELFVQLLTEGIPRDVVPLPGYIRFRARWQAIAYVQRQQRRARILGGRQVIVPSSPPADSPEILAFRGEVRRRLVQAFLTLAPRMRTATRLRFLHEKLHVDVAAEMGITQSSVNAMLRTAKLRLCDLLADVYEPTGRSGKWEPNRRSARNRRRCR